MTSLHARPKPAINTTLRALLTSMIPAGLIVVAILVSMTQAPWGVRIVAAVVLVALPGAAVAALLFGEQADPALRLPMTALFGLMLWLAVALVLNLIGTSISATSLAIGVGVVGVPAA